MIEKALCALPLALVLAGSASANVGKAPEDILDALAAKSKSQYLVQSPQNRMMMPDNPAYEVIEEGEKLWKQKRGAKNATLDQCDFGKGPGVLKGAYVELPRYFADTGKVMDLESRLVHCMKTLQGYADDAPEVKKRHGNDASVTKLMSYIAYQSSGMPWNPPMNHPMEKAMRNAGEVLFYRRSGTMDFNCATCHMQPGGRIRASYLPYIKKAEEWTKAISWPAHRTGQENVRSSQHRILECLWQMRYPNIRPDSDVNIAIISFWTDAARGQPTILPDLKR